MKDGVSILKVTDYTLNFTYGGRRYAYIKESRNVIPLEAANEDGAALGRTLTADEADEMFGALGKPIMSSDERLKRVYAIAKNMCSCYVEGMPCAYERMTEKQYEVCPDDCPVGEIRKICNQ